METLFPRREQKSIVRRRFCPDALRIDHVDLVVNHAVVDRIFDERRRVRHAPKPREIAFVFGEEEIARVFAKQTISSERVMRCFDDVDLGGGR